MKNIRWTLLALLLLAAPQASHAQAPVDPGLGEAPTTTTTTTTTTDQGQADTGAISTTDTTSTTTTGVSPDGAMAEMAPMDGESGSTSGSLPNTGGEPILMSLAGLAIAAVAFGARRKVIA